MKKITSKSITTFIIIIYIFIIGVGMHYHEMWRDELEIYMRIGYTHHLFIEGDFSFIAYHFLMQVFMLFSNSENTFQLYHFAIIVCAAYVFIRFSNIPLTEKILFIFSYFMIYEYGIISRYYGFMLLLIFLIIYFLTKKPQNYLIIVILILILANHSIQGTIFSASLFIYFILDKLFIEARSREPEGKRSINFITTKYSFRFNFTKNKIWFHVILFICGWTFMLILHSLYSIKNRSYLGWEDLSSPPIFMLIRTIWNSYLPIPDLNAGIIFWNTNIVNYPYNFFDESKLADFINFPNLITFIISLLIFIITVIKFSSKLKVMIIFFFTTIVYLIFLNFLKAYAIRYQGGLFIIFMFCYWLYYIGQKTIENGKWRMNKIYKINNKIFKPMLFLILTAQVFSALYSLSLDIKYKFTLSQDAAKYISDNKLNKTHTMFGYHDFIAQTIAAHTKTKIYFIETNNFSYYFGVFNKNRKLSTSSYELYETCANFTEKKHKKVLFIASFPLTFSNNQLIHEAMISKKTKIKLLKSFSGDRIVEDEQFWIYEAEQITE